MRYLLDTNIVSDLVRNPQGKVAQHISKVGRSASLYKHHRRCGVALRGYQKRLTAGSWPARSGAWGVGSLALRGAGQVPPTGLLRTRLEQVGRPIGANDSAHCGSDAFPRFTPCHR